MSANDGSTVRRWGWDATTRTHPWWNMLHKGQHWVYFIRDAVTGQLLYVGCTSNVPRRVGQHVRGRRSEYTVEIEGPFRSRMLAEATETHYIRTLRPVRNVRMCA